MKTIEQWQIEVHELAKQKGWYEGAERNPLEMHALIASEIGEATNEARKDLPFMYQVGTDQKEWKDGAKPHGEAVELADAVIRILDYFQYRGWNLEQVIELKHDYNKSRSYRHGGKKY